MLSQSAIMIMLKLCKWIAYLCNSIVQLNDSPKRDAWIGFLSKHGVSFAWPGGAVHEHGAVESVEQDVDKVFGGALKSEKLVSEDWNQEIINKDFGINEKSFYFVEGIDRSSLYFVNN